MLHFDRKDKLILLIGKCLFCILVYSKTILQEQSKMPT